MKDARRDPFEVLKEAEQTATKSGKKIIHYILSHRSDMQYIPLSQLSDACSVSEATISRFCHSLGYENYFEFKIAISKACSNPILSITPIAPQAITLDDSITEMANKLLTNNLCAMQETLNNLDEAEIRRAVNLLSTAQDVYCFGQGASGILAMHTWARFSTISNRFRYVEDSHLQIMTTALATSNDVLLFFCYSGETRDMQEILPVARERGLKVILITHYPYNPASKDADVVLVCGSNEHLVQMGSISAKISTLYLVDILVNEYSRMNPEMTSRNRALAVEAVTKKHI